MKMICILIILMSSVCFPECIAPREDGRAPLLPQEENNVWALDVEEGRRVELQPRVMVPHR